MYSMIRKNKSSNYLNNSNRTQIQNDQEYDLLNDFLNKPASSHNKYNQNDGIIDSDDYEPLSYNREAQMMQEDQFGIQK